ncbi:MAG: MFS transporter [Kineosporiaceae bacterium]
MHACPDDVRPAAGPADRGPAPVAGRRRVREVRPLTAVSLAQIGGGFAGGANAAYIVVAADRLGVSAGSLGWIASAFGFALVAVALSGRYLLRLGAGRLLQVAAGLGVLSAVVMATVPSLPLLVPAAAAGGLSGAGMLLASVTLLRGAASSMSLATGFASLASLVAPVTIGLIELAGYSGGWALLLPVPFLLAAAAAGVRADHPDRSVRAAAADRAAGGAPRTADGPVARPEPALARPRWVSVAAAWAAIVLAVAAEFSFFTWGVARLVDSGLGIGAAAVAGVAFPLGMVVGRFAGARLPDASSPVLRGRLRLAAAVTGVATLAVVAGPWPLVAAGLLVAGLALSTTYPTGLSLLVRVPGLPLRLATSLGVAASGVAISTAPLALAALAGVTDLRLAFLLPLPLLALLVVAVHPRWARPSVTVPAPREDRVVTAGAGS